MSAQGGRGLDAAVVVRRDGFALDAALTAAPGETVAVLGPNGAGKTTLLAALAGLTPLDAGHVRLDDRDVAPLPAGERGVGVVFQDLRLFPALSACDNVAFGLRARGVARRRARQLAVAVLDELGVAHRADASPATLSGGEAQRVALARALAVRPRLLLLDEPLSALDAEARADVRGWLRRVLAAFDGPTLLVTHEPLEALALADRLVILEGGRVTQDGHSEDIRLRPRSAFAAALAGVNVVRGRVRRGPAGLRVVGDDGSLTVAATDLAEGAAVVATVHPRAVGLSRERPRGSARNVLAARVADVEFHGERARVRLDARPPLVAEVTTVAVVDLGLAAGERVWASVKATEVAVAPH